MKSQADLPRQARCFRPQLSRAIDELIQRALHPRPEHRFASVADMASAMRAILDPSSPLEQDLRFEVV